MLDDHRDVGPKPLRDLVTEANGLRNSARWHDAANAYDEVLRRLDHDSEHSHDLALRIAYLRIVCLIELHDPQETSAACDALLSRYSSSSNDSAVAVCADTLWLKGRAL